MNDAVKLPWRETGRRFWWIAALLVALDQLTKMWIERTMVLGDGFTLLPVFNIVRAHNSGAAFSFLADENGWQRWFFSGLAIAVSIGIVHWLRRVVLTTHAWLAVGLSLILGGAIGNVIDRIQHGFVVDFVQLHWGSHYFPAFNVADSGISIGAVLVVLDGIREWRRERALKTGLPK